MNLAIISAFEPTPVDGARPWRFMNIAESAQIKGHNVTFYTSTFNHYKKEQRYQTDTVIKVNHRYTLNFVYSKSYKRNIGFARLLSHLSFANRLVRILKKGDKPDLIFISYPPVSSAFKVSQFAKENNIPLILDIIDPWPDVFLNVIPKNLQFLKKILFFNFYYQLNETLENSSAITAISQEYLDWARTRGHVVQSHCFFPAINLRNVRKSLAVFSNSRDVNKNTNQLRILYAGALASSYDIELILKVAAYFYSKMKDRVKFVIGGVGPKSDLVVHYTKQYSNIEYLGWLDENELYKQQYLADLGLIQHVVGATQSVTYKFFDYLGAGLPILNSLNSEMWSLIDKHNLGLNNRSGSELELIQNISLFLDDPDKRIEYSKNAIQFASEYGDKDVVYNILVEVMERVQTDNN